MKKIKLFLVFTLVLALTLLLGSCTMMLPTTQTQTCVAHRDINKDLLCDVCGAVVPVNCTSHNDLDHDGKCDTNGCTVTLAVYHVDPDHTGICEVCGKKVTVNHVDLDDDGLCDDCGKPADGSCLECVDEDEDGECDVCGNEVEVPAEPCDECVDENEDLVCDVCGGAITVCEHTDKNFDGKCDDCKKDIEGAVQILNKGTTQFKFVLANGSSGDHVGLVDKLITDLMKLGVTVEDGEDKSDKTTEYEVLFGLVQNRDEEYRLDPHTYGMKGYTAQLIGNKIIVLGGSDKALSDAVEALKESFFGITEDTKSLRNAVRYISAAQNVIEIQDDYAVSSITLFGEDIRDYKIAADSTSAHAYNTALALQSMLYTKVGYWLDVVDPDAQTEKVIVISYAAKTGGDGYYVTFSEGKMEFVSEYSTVIQSELTAFFTKKLALADGTLNITAADNFVKNVRDVYYKDFGANGDDDNDDAEAIRAAHEYANQDGHKVFADFGATYYIGLLEKTITIKTDVDWRDAKFMLQDHLIAPLDKSASGVTYRGVMIFTIDRDTPSTSSFPGLGEKIKEINTAGGIDASTFKSFEFNFGSKMLLNVYNNQHKNYIRYGVNENAGSNQTEMILVNADGSLDPTTPFMFDYNYIHYIICYPVDDTPITVQGGEFYTSPWFTDDGGQDYLSYGRGILCNRSNVTVKNVKHYLINEGDYSSNDHNYGGGSVDYGCPYGGFYCPEKCNNVVFEDCIASGHIAYTGKNGAGMGTYDVSPGDATNILFKNCYQEDDNFFSRAGENGIAQYRWGVMGSSGCKNVTYDGCRLTRFDAHAGIHNATIRNSALMDGIRVVGTGTLKIEGSTIYAWNLIDQREDYGGFWHGNIIIKDVTIANSNSQIVIFKNVWYNHYFGYPTGYATNVIVDGLKVYSDRDMTKPATAPIKLFSDTYYTDSEKITSDYLQLKDAEGLLLYYPNGAPVMTANINQTPPPERIILRNVEIDLIVPDNTLYPWFASTVISVNESDECNAHFDWTGDLKCDDCGADFTPCEEHTDYNKDGKCTWCGADMDIPCDKHIDKDLNGECDKCLDSYVCDGHTDENEDRICDECGGVLGCKEPHVDAGEDGKCDVCRKKIPTCQTCTDVAPHDSKCDKCKADMVALKDSSAED